MTRNVRIPAVLGALLLAGASAVSIAQAGEPVRPAIQAQPRVHVRATLPRVTPSAVLSQSEMVAPENIHAITNLALVPYSFEAEDWGEMPELGFTVQDMSGWGSQWSGNRQIFWNPQAPGNAFKWDFSAVGGRLLHINLTAAPDYADLTIRLGCYEQVSEHQYQLRAQVTRAYNGYAAAVTRRQVIFNVALDPRCRDADMFRLLFTANPVTNRRFAGIDNIVVTR